MAKTISQSAIPAAVIEASCHTGGYLGIEISFFDAQGNPTTCDAPRWIVTGNSYGSMIINNAEGVIFAVDPSDLDTEDII